MVKGRDFIMLCGVIELNGLTYIFAKGPPDEEKYPEKKNIVRGTLKIGGWII